MSHEYDCTLYFEVETQDCYFDFVMYLPLKIPPQKGLIITFVSNDEERLYLEITSVEVLPQSDRYKVFCDIYEIDGFHNGFDLNKGANEVRNNFMSTFGLNWDIRDR